MAYIRSSIYNTAEELGMTERDINKLSMTVRRISKIARKEAKLEKSAELQTNACESIEEDSYEERD